MDEGKTFLCFDNDTGHLTDEALRKLISGKLDELSRLEAAEHLSFCDRCIDRYTALLTDQVLLDAPDTLRRGVLEKIRQRLRRFYLSKYCSMGLAACIAMILWFTGCFTMLATPPEMMEDRSLSQYSDSFSQRMEEVSQSFSQSLTQLMEQILPERSHQQS